MAKAEIKVICTNIFQGRENEISREKFTEKWIQLRNLQNQEKGLMDSAFDCPGKQADGRKREK